MLKLKKHFKNDDMSGKTKTIYLILLILVIAIFFRFWQLNEIPPGLYPDVAINGNDALKALQTGHFKLFYPENNGREGLFINLIALSFWLFGVSIWAIKIVPATIGVLTVLGMYLMAKEMFKKNPKHQASNPKQITNSNDRNSKRFRIWNLKNWDLFENWKLGFEISRGEIIALLSSFFLAISFWHVNFSRIGFRAIAVPFFLVWSFYFLFKGLNATRIYESHTDDADNAKTTISFVLAGVLFGLGFHTYISFRIAPLILVPILIIEIVRYWPRFKSLITKHLSLNTLTKQVYLKDGWWRWDVFFVVIILVALPLAIYFIQHPQDFMGRTGQVSVFADPNPLKALAISTVKTLGQFMVWGDTNWRHNLAGSPQIFWPLIPVFLVGLFYSFTQLFKKQNYQNKNWPLITTYWTLIIWWVAMLMPAIMTNEGLPHALRSIGAIPPSYIFIGLGSYLIIGWLWTKIKNRQVLILIYSLLLIGLLAIGVAEYWRYFVLWGKNLQTRYAFTQRVVDEANYLKSLPTWVQKYVFVNEEGVPVPYPDGLPMPAQTIIFLTQKKSEIKYFKRDPGSFFRLPMNVPAVFLPLAPDQKLFEQLQERNPHGQVEKISDFIVFKIGF